MSGVELPVAARGVSGGVTSRPDALRALARLLLVLVAAAAGAVLFYIYYVAAHKVGLENPDNLSFVLAGRDILNGNWNLHGWALANNAWWPVQPVVYAGAVLTRGYFRAPFYVAAFTWTVTAACAVWLAVRPFRGAAAIAAAAVAFFLVGLPPDLAVTTPLEFIFAAPFQALTTAGSLCALALLASAFPAPVDSPRGRTTRRPVRAGLAAASVILAGAVIASDTLALATIVFPAIALFAFSLLRDARGYRAAAGAAFAVLAWELSRALLWLLTQTHGLRLLESVNWITFASFDTLVTRNLGLAVQGLLAFFGGYWFDRPVFHPATPIVLVRLAALLFVLWAVWRAVCAAWVGRAQDWLVSVLALGFVSNLGAYTVSVLPSDIGSSRYLLTLLPFGGVVAARAAGDAFNGAGLRKKTALGGAILLLGYSSFSAFGWWFDQHPVFPPRPDLIEWLEKHDLRYGYAPYEEAAPITVASEGRVVVRPVHDEGGQLRPSPWAAKQWYWEPARFVVLRDDVPDVRLRNAERTFGVSHEIHRIGPYRVIVWQNATPLVEPGRE